MPSKYVALSPQGVGGTSGANGKALFTSFSKGPLGSNVAQNVDAAEPLAPGPWGDEIGDLFFVLKGRRGLFLPQHGAAVTFKDRFFGLWAPSDFLSS